MYGMVFLGSCLNTDLPNKKKEKRRDENGKRYRRWNKFTSTAGLMSIDLLSFTSYLPQSNLQEAITCYVRTIAVLDGFCQ